jgi:hypothetical protein
MPVRVERTRAYGYHPAMIARDAASDAVQEALRAGWLARRTAELRRTRGSTAPTSRTATPFVADGGILIKRSPIHGGAMGSGLSDIQTNAAWNRTDITKSTSVPRRPPQIASTPKAGNATMA